MIYQQILRNSLAHKKQLAVLIDPDKASAARLEKLLSIINDCPPDFFFIGGSLIANGCLQSTLEYLKKNTAVPLVIFPGSTYQVDSTADAILILSLISGRNAEMLIGNHVLAAPALRKSALELIPTGYMLIESGTLTSVLYMSNTTPIPNNKTDIALCTAMAGEMLGLKMIYMDAGSGAEKIISEKMIRTVKENINIPLIIGGGINTAEKAYNAWNSGADMLVVGNALEKSPEFFQELIHVYKAQKTV